MKFLLLMVLGLTPPFKGGAYREFCLTAFAAK